MLRKSNRCKDGSYEEQWVEIRELKTSERRRHNERSFIKMRESISESGQNFPIMVALDGRVLDGCCRIDAVASLGGTIIKAIVVGI